MKSATLDMISTVAACITIGCLIASMTERWMILVAFPIGIITVIADHYAIKKSFQEFHSRERTRK